MSRSPLAYPLTRGIDGDSGGAADLQTDIMRFMAILALCLVAIFALVQSLPIAPETPDVGLPAIPEPIPVALPTPVEVPAAEQRVESSPEPVAQPALNRQVSLTRPSWTPKYTPATRTVEEPATPSAPAAAKPPIASPPAVAAAEPDSETAPPASERQGFTLRFESDLALTRLVASGQVGFYAIEPGRAQRMSVRDSRISFCEASTPNEFHEMETATVPQPVVDALSRSGATTSAVSFGVTLPSRLRGQLVQLMNDHRGGALVIGADGNLQLEAGG